MTIIEIVLWFLLVGGIWFGGITQYYLAKKKLPSNLDDFVRYKKTGSARDLD